LHKWLQRHIEDAEWAIVAVDKTRKETIEKAAKSGQEKDKDKVVSGHMTNVFVTLANVFVTLANVFVTLANVFVTLANVFVTLANIFVTLVNVFTTRTKFSCKI
jgi:hypothetical protein